LSVLRNAACLLLGAAVATAALAVHRDLPPWGLLLALGATYATAWWLLRSTRPVGGAMYVAGWLAVLAVALLGRPEGDYVIANDVRGWTMILGGLGLVVLGVVSLALQRPPAS
jgi:hypothetical protein